MNDNYCRNAEVLRVIDGDTIDLLIDLGFGTKLKERVRLAGIDTPEIFGPRNEAERHHGLAAKAYVEWWCRTEEWQVVLESKEFNRGKYGRILGDLWAGTSSLTECLLAEGFAKKEHY